MVIFHSYVRLPEGISWAVNGNILGYHAFYGKQYDGKMDNLGVFYGYITNRLQ